MSAPSPHCHCLSSPHRIRSWTSDTNDSYYLVFLTLNLYSFSNPSSSLEAQESKFLNDTPLSLVKYRHFLALNADVLTNCPLSFQLHLPPQIPVRSMHILLYLPYPSLPKQLIFKQSILTTTIYWEPTMLQVYALHEFI